jgi:signal transduction histidine kinase
MRDSLQVIEEESDRLGELIDNLLDASRVQAGNFRLALVELDIDQLVVKVVEKFRPQAKNHTLVAGVPANLPLVQADEARITQVLSNLISNAIKYSPEGGEIRVTGVSTPKDVIITVSDKGPGIAPEEQAQLFNRFYRVDNAMTRKTQGAGLGLYLSKAIVEAHGGRIWVESDGHNGSRFSFSLPRAG